MCGPDAAQTQLESSQAAFYDTLQKQDAVQYGEDQQILTQMQGVYAPILAAGPNQYGFSPAEDQVLNTEATEGVAGNFAGASKALKEQMASEGGGDEYLPSGVKDQQLETLDSAAATTAANEKLQIKQSGFNQGYNQFTQATNALEGTAGLLSPTAAANAATSAGSAEGTTANQIAQENESWMAPLAGAVGAIGGAALTPKPPCWIAAELWGGWNEPRTVKVRTWLVYEFAETQAGRILMPIYMRFGERSARAIHRWPILRAVFLPLFNLALKKAGE